MQTIFFRGLLLVLHVYFNLPKTYDAIQSEDCDYNWRQLFVNLFHMKRFVAFVSNSILTEILGWFFFRPRGQKSWRRFLTSMSWVRVIHWDMPKNLKSLQSLEWFTISRTDSLFCVFYGHIKKVAAKRKLVMFSGRIKKKPTHVRIWKSLSWNRRIWTD